MSEYGDRGGVSLCFFGGGATVGHGNVHREDAASARSARTARLLAVDSERAVARASSPKPIDILVWISMYERTGSRPTASKNPVSSSVVWPCTPDQTASPAVVTSSTSHRPPLTQAWMRRRSETKVDLAASRSAGSPSLNAASPGPNITAYRWGSRSAKRR